MADQRLFSLLFVGILWGCVLGLQRPAPRYSQQLMPDTSFTCRHKIVGSYYADPETDCQLFHVCVSVAGSIQDYRFLCPNDTAFDQESQTCADWYDVDCEAATLYYASDNFDLYRLGSGLESLHYDSVRNDVEAQDHLQRSESSDPIRSSIQNSNRAASGASSNGNNNKNNQDILRGSSSSNFFNNRNNGKEDDYDNDKTYREDTGLESRRKQGVRKVARKQQYDNNNSNNIQPTTSRPSTTFANQNRNNNYQNNGNNFNQRQNSNSFVSPTTVRPFVEQENYNNNNNFARNNQNNNNQKYNTPASTYRPTTVNSYQENTSGYNNQQTNYNNFNSNKFSGNQQNFASSSFPQSPVASSTFRPTDYTANVSNKKKPSEETGQTFGNQYTGQLNKFSTQSTTPRATTNFQPNDYTTYQQKNYNNIQRTTRPATTDFQTTTIVPTFYEDYTITGRLNELQNINKVTTTTREQEFAQTTPRSTNNFAGSSYIPTTYSPVTKKLVTNGDNNQGQTAGRGNDQYTGQYESGRTTNGGQYREKTTQQTGQVYKNTQSYDTTRPNFGNNDNNGQYRDAATKAPKKVTQFNNYDTKFNYDGTTRSFDNFDQSRTGSVAGFSPASVNKLAESPVTQRPTTPVARRTVYNSPNTQRPSSSATNFEPQTTPNTRTGSFVSGTAKPFTSTPRPVEQQRPTTVKPKTSKKNDYDYAYYDNAGTLEYDGLDFEQVAGSRDSAKISRN